MRSSGSSARPRRVRGTVTAAIGVVLAGLSACTPDHSRPTSPDPNADAGSSSCLGYDCTLGYDNQCQTGTLDLPIDTLELPVPLGPDVVPGWDIDGLTTTSATDRSGCFAKDTKYSPTSTYSMIDNAMVGVAPALTTLGLDLSTAFALTVDRSTSATPRFDLGLRVGQWSHADRDSCVAVYVSAPGWNMPRGQVTSLSGGVSGWVSNWQPIPLVAHLVRSGCTPDPANGVTCEADVEMPLEAASLQLHVAASGAAWTLVTNRPLESEPASVANPSMLAGAIRFWDPDGYSPARTCGDGNPLAPGTLAYELAEAAPALGLDAAGAKALCEAFASRLDLRLLGPSSGTSATEPCADGTKRPNALSIGLYLGSGYHATTTVGP